MNYNQIIDRLEYIEVMQQIVLSDHFSIDEARSLYREREELLQKLSNMDLVGHKPTKPTGIIKIMIYLAISLFLLLLMVLCSCSPKIGEYKAYPIDGGDTIIVKHLKYNGRNFFNPGEPVPVDKRKRIVDRDSTSKTYIILNRSDTRMK